MVDPAIFNAACTRLTELTDGLLKADRWFSDPANKDSPLVDKLVAKHKAMLAEMDTHLATLAKAHFVWDWRESDGKKGLKPAPYLECPRGCADHEPTVVRHPAFRDLEPSIPFPEESEIGALVEWLEHLGVKDLPKTPFKFLQGEVTDADRFLYGLRIEAMAGMNGPKAKTGALLSELQALYSLVGAPGRPVAGAA